MPDRDTIDIAKSHFLSVPAEQTYPSFGPRWSAYAAWFRESIDRLLSPADVVHFAQDKFGFELRERQPVLKQSIEKWEAKVRADFPTLAEYFADWSDSSLSTPDSIVEHNGRLMSSMLCHLIRFHFAALTYFPKPATVCEIGGGYGAPARVWLTSKIHCPRRYVIIDLPESLFFAEVFLRTELPHIPLIHLATNTATCVSDPHIVLCPATMLDKAPRDVELVVNTLSMQEMSEDWIDVYMEWLDTTSANHFYSFNALGRPISEMREAANSFSPRPTGQWRARSISFPYGGDAAEILFDRQSSMATLAGAMPAGEPDQLHLAASLDKVRVLPTIENLEEFILAYIDTRPLPKEIHYINSLLLRQNPQHRHAQEWASIIGTERASGREAIVGPEASAYRR